MTAVAKSGIAAKAGHSSRDEAGHSSSDTAGHGNSDKLRHSSDKAGHAAVTNPHLTVVT